MKTDKKYQTKAKWSNPIDISIPRTKEEINSLMFDVGRDLTHKLNDLFGNQNIDIRWTNYQHETENPSGELGQFRIIAPREKPTQ